ncbi:MAG: OmpH family outer membrane protein [Bacteroidales bacterium]|jgi:outer membrane protein|nr:OmpH family outer membrane protein [Bacteroidales bacterium]
MKKIIVVLFALVCFAGAKNLSAQKFGHINFAELSTLIPGYDAAQAAFEQYYAELQKQLEAMHKEYEAKMSEYTTNVNSMTQLIKSAKEREIADLEMRITEFSNSATQDLNAKQAELLNPIFEKAKKAIEDVAKENGYTYIFNNTEGIMLYANPSDDVMDLVKKKLGI